MLPVAAGFCEQDLHANREFKSYLTLFAFNSEL